MAPNDRPSDAICQLNRAPSEHLPGRGRHGNICSMETASILHADLDSFYASVEQRDRPELRGQPVIVGAGVVLAASYEAKAFGVESAMGGTRARRLCPHASSLEPRMDAYVDASRRVFEIFDRTTPLVEGLSIDEAFLDVRGLEGVSGSPAEIAVRLRSQVREEVGLPITVGVARTKFLAKVASGVAKPDGLLVVPAGGELEFLHPLPVRRLWGVGPITADRLARRGIETVSQVATMPEEGLIAIVGQGAGRHLHALALNHDPRPVQTGRRRRSVGAQCALGAGPPLAGHAGGAAPGAGRPRDQADAARRPQRPDGHAPPALRRLHAGDALLHPLRPDRRDPADPVRRGPAAADGRAGHRRAWHHPGRRDRVPLDDGHAMQLVLPLSGERGAALDAALDHVRDRFGSSAITRASLLGRSLGPSVPLLRE